MSVFKPVRLAAALAIVLSAAAAAAQDAAPPRTVVLVHGAFADGSSWNKVIPLLAAKGIKVVAVQNPLTSLADDVAATKRALADVEGPAVLVGHSWGGVVITEAGTDPKVTGLVYVAALVPEDHQSVGEMVEGKPPSPGFAAIKKDAAGYLFMTPEGIAQDFAQDVSPAEAATIAVTQGLLNSTCLGDKVSTAAWKTKPSWYVVTTADRMIAPDAEAAMAAHIGAKVTTLATSHVPMLSQPEKVAAVIAEAAMAK